MSTLPRFTRDQLEQMDKEALIELVLSLQERLNELSQRVQQLEDQVAKHSRNSNKPPSSDGLRKPKTRSLRKASGRKPGGQPGHPGHTLEMRETPDHVEVHQVEECPHCHRDLREVAAIAYRRRQVFDLPPVQIEVTEHRTEIKQCPDCQRVVQAEFPPHVTQPVQYGPRIKAQASYLNTYQMIPVARTCELLEDFYGHAPSWDLVRQANEAVAAGSAPALVAIETRLRQAKVVHCDESGLRVAGKLHWVHTASTPEVTLLGVHPKRGREAMTELGVLPTLKQWVMHDYWASYLSFTDCQHAFCNAHNLRELRFITEQYQQPWAEKMAHLLLEIKETVEAAKAAGDTALSSEQLAHFETRYDTLLEEGFQANPSPPKPKAKKPGRLKQTPPKNLLDRLQKHKAGVLAFMYDFDLPFDNNLAERDIRMVKLKQKTSGAFRTITGAQTFAAIRSYIATVRKQGGNVIRALHDALLGQPVYPVSS